MSKDQLLSAKPNNSHLAFSPILCYNDFDTYSEIIYERIIYAE